MAPERNPYVGPQPFETEDADRFFGRTREIRDLTSLVIAHRVVLLYSASGAGKSSLINAGVVPALVERGYQVLAGGRVGAPVPAGAHAANVFSASLISQWDAEMHASTVAGLLAAFPRGSDEEGSPQPRVLVIDQFEEIFTAHPAHWNERTSFFVELREALEADDALRLVLALREEYVTQLDPYAELLPTRLRTRFRLERLDDASAREAVEKPLRDTHRSFTPAAVAALVRNLRKVRVQTADGQTQEVEGAYVEPVQLQVVCQELWARLPDNVELITPEHLEALADLDVVLGRFYEDALSAAAERARVRERRLRRWVWDELVTPGGTRSTVYRGPDASAGLPNAAVDVLEDKRLIRAEERAGAKWYELTHDRLIEPIRRSNERFSARRRRTLLKTAVALAPILLIGLPLGIGFGVGGGKSSSGGVVVPAALTPSGLDFGVIHDPRAAQDQSLILSSGSKDQRVSLHKSGDANDFVVDSGCGDKLKARKTCTITVLFSPTRLGKRVASVRIGDSTDLEAQLTGSLGGRCGIERWAVKTLTDPDAARVDLNPKPTTIADLVRLPIPANIGSSRAAPVELSTFRVRARLVAMKLEDDQDIHLVIADPATGATMVTEFPAAACIVGATPSFQEKMNAARGALVSRCGLPSGRLFTALRGTASLTGVGFFDRIHGQNGQAPNGIELHPVLAFSADCGTAALLPDLVISSYNFILRGRRIVGSVVVANVGAVESPRTSVEVVAPVPFVPARVPVPSLAPNKSFRARLILVRPVGRTATNVVVTVDPQGRVREQNESNNARPVIIRLPPTPPPPPLPQPEPAPLPPPVTTIIGG